MYIITGTYNDGSTVHEFEKEIEAENEEHAEHIIKSRIGSNHGTQRTNIKIHDCKKV